MNPGEVTPSSQTEDLKCSDLSHSPSMNLVAKTQGLPQGRTAPGEGRVHRREQSRADRLVWRQGRERFAYLLARSICRLRKKKAEELLKSQAFPRLSAVLPKNTSSLECLFHGYKMTAALPTLSVMSKRSTHHGILFPPHKTPFVTILFLHKFSLCLTYQY